MWQKFYKHRILKQSVSATDDEPPLRLKSYWVIRRWARWYEHPLKSRYRNRNWKEFRNKQYKEK